MTRYPRPAGWRLAAIAALAFACALPEAAPARLTRFREKVAPHLTEEPIREALDLVHIFVKD